MPKAKTKITTKAKSKAPPREGLALIDATYQRKTAREPDLKRELMLLRQSNDAAALAVVYDAYMAAADAMMGMENQPRAKNSNLLEGEWNWLILKAWTVAEQIARLQPNDHDQEAFAQILFNTALDMGNGLDGANSALQAYLAVGAAK
jgi:hypothetical protein